MARSDLSGVETFDIVVPRDEASRLVRWFEWRIQFVLVCL